MRLVADRARVCRLLRTGLTSLLLVALSAWGRAQAPGITLEAKAGFRGHMRVKHWAPVACLIANQSVTRVKGDLVVVMATPHDRAQRYTTPVDLPTPSKQRFTIYIRPAHFISSVTVELRREGGELLASQMLPVRALDTRDLVVAALSAEDIGVRAREVRDPDDDLGHPIEAFSIEEDDLPDRARGYETLDVLIVDGLGLKRLSSDQREALRRWILAGGRLVVGTGEDWDLVRDGALADLLPVELVGSRVMALGRIPTPRRGMAPCFRGRPRLPLALFDPMDSVVVAEGRWRRAPEVLAEVGSEWPSLIVAGRLGKGEVFYLAFDLHSRTVRTSPHRPRFYRELLSRAASGIGNVDARRPMDGRALQSAVLQTPATEVPPLWWVSVFLGIYLLVVGPVEYFALKRLRRLELTWLTFPLLVAVFTYGAYRAAASFKGGQTLVNEISVLWQRGDMLHAETYFGLYSPRQASYHIAVEEPSASLVALEGAEQLDSTVVMRVGPQPPPSQPSFVYVSVPGADHFEGAPDTPGLSQRESGGELRDVRVNQWSMRTFRSRWWLPGQIEGDLECTETDVRGTVTNDTPFDLEHCWIAYKERLCKLGFLDEGASVQFETSEQKSQRRVQRMDAGVLGGQDSQETQARIVALQVAARRLGLLAEFPQVAYYWYEPIRPSEQWPNPQTPLFFGFATEPALPVLLDGREAPRRSVVLVVAELPGEWVEPW